MDNLYKQFKPALIVVIVICIVTLFIQFFTFGSLNWYNLKTSLFYNAYYGIPLSFINGWFFDYLSIKVPWDGQARKRAIIGVLGSIAITMLSLVILNWIFWVLINGNDISSLWRHENRMFYTYALFITILVSTAIHAITFFNEIQKEKKLNSALRQEMLQTELNALRAHVDPHFLFNSFNVLSGLIDEDQDKAQDFLAGLSKIYRYILEQRGNSTTSLQSELDFARRYINLQKTRFEDSIELEVSISQDSMTRELPSLTLQLLLENAIKHNAFSKSDPLKIVIKDKDNSLVMTNNIRQRNHLVASNKMGLQNIRDRFALLSDQNIEIQKSSEQFKVILPLL